MALENNIHLISKLSVNNVNVSVLSTFSHVYPLQKQMLRQNSCKMFVGVAQM